MKGDYLFTEKEIDEIKKIVLYFPEAEVRTHDDGCEYVMSPEVPRFALFTFKLPQYRLGVLIDSIDRDVTITEFAAEFGDTGLLVECATLLLRANQLVKRLELVFDNES